MKHTPFYQTHIDAGAKMGEFAGFEMPLFYPLGVMKEHLHTRSAAGLFDISHMVHVEVIGAQVAEFISFLCPYDASSQSIGKAQYTFFLNENAGIIDDLIVTRLDEEKFLIVSNAGCAEKDLAHIRTNAKRFEVETNHIERAFLALQGPLAENVLSDLKFAVEDLEFMTGIEPETGWFLSRTGYTGEDGFEIAMPNDEALEFANKLVSDERVEWIGLGARDSLRLEAGLSLYGQDLDEDITPHEAGLIWAIPKNLREGGSYIGANTLSDKIKQGRRRVRLGFEPDGRPVRAGTKLVNEAGQEIGYVTSGGFGPTINGPIALGLVNVDDADNPIFAELRGKQIPMTRAKLPFTPHNYKR